MSEHKIKALLMGLIAAGTALWGWFGWLAILWALCMALDFVTGCMAAAKEHAWSSGRAREGLWHKLGMFVAVIVAGITDLLLHLLAHADGISLPFPHAALLTPLVMAWYALSELGSIAENALRLGAPVPKWLKKILKLTADTLDKTGEEMTGGAEHD